MLTDKHAKKEIVKIRVNTNWSVGSHHAPGGVRFRRHHRRGSSRYNKNT